MKTKYLLFIFYLSISYHSLIGQDFVSQSNKWLIDDCCESNCTTFEYWFDDPTIINSKTYLKLKTDNLDPIYLFNPTYGEYYREEEGLVYMKYNEDHEEILIYNFNLTVGETLQFPGTFAFEIEVTSIDSVILNSGEKRKRLKIQRTGLPSQVTYWIEGIGSLSSPMNPENMWVIDKWTELVCYHKANNLEYGLGDCEPTDLRNINQLEKTISYYPNPATEQIIITSTDQENFEHIEIIEINGKSILQVISNPLQPISLNGIRPGLYFLKVTFKDGSIALTKFVKNKN